MHLPALLASHAATPGHAVAVVWVALVAGACAGGEDAASRGDPAPSGSCPASVDVANGGACRGPLVCGYPLTCGAFVQHAECACERGRFVCSDAHGTIAPGEAARCVDASPASEATCPATMKAMSGQACDDVGETCFFAGFACPAHGGIRNLDYCACKPDAQGKLRFDCTVLPCPPYEPDAGQIFAAGDSNERSPAPARSLRPGARAAERSPQGAASKRYPPSSP